jgi:hypothetical protein
MDVAGISGNAPSHAAIRRFVQTFRASFTTWCEKVPCWVKWAPVPALGGEKHDLCIYSVIL